MLEPKGALAVVVAVLLHAGVPGAGLAAYGWLVERMKKDEVPEAPVASLFVVFACYGGWLLVLLTGLTWYWSGMASLGAAFLVVVAPFVMMGLALRLRRRAALSPYHRRTFVAAAVYAPAVVLLVGAVLLFSDG